MSTKSVIPALLQINFKKYFGWEVTMPMILKYFNNGLKDEVKKIARALGKTTTPEQVEEFTRMMLDHKFTDKIPLLPNVENLLGEIKRRELKMALCSNNFHSDLEKIIVRQGLEGCFDVIVGEDDVLKKKPAPDMILRALEVLGFEREEVILIDDSSTGIKAGKSAGIKVLATATGIQDVDTLWRFEPDRVVADLTEITLEEILKI